MKLTAPQKTLAATLGHEFNETRLLIEALTHASLSSPETRDNQRLEFLGDRVLGLVIAEELLRRQPEASEGDLAPRYNMLVRKEACAAVAEEIDLGPALLMGRSEQSSGGRRKMALLGDAMEAVIAAVYLDGGFDAARAMVLRLWQHKIETVKDDARDPKTTLQEWAQARGLPPPDYIDAGRIGPDHAPEFEVRVVLRGGEEALGRAGNKRAAQKAAAEALLVRLEEN